MFATTSALRQASRRIATSSIRNASSKANAARVNEESLRKVMPWLVAAAGGVAIGTSQLFTVCFRFVNSY